MPKLINRIGKIYGNLYVVGRAINDVHGNAQWNCKCLCGKFLKILGQQLTKGQKSCGCVTSHLRPYESLYNRLRSMTKHIVNLSYVEFEKFTQINECHYCGKKLIWRERYAGKGGWQLDRKDSKLGYSVENCVPCCKRCNFGKGKGFTYEEWKQIGAVIRSWNAK